MFLTFLIPLLPLPGAPPSPPHFPLSINSPDIAPFWSFSLVSQIDLRVLSSTGEVQEPRVKAPVLALLNSVQSTAIGVDDTTRDTEHNHKRGAEEWGEKREDWQRTRFDYGKKAHNRMNRMKSQKV